MTSRREFLVAGVGTVAASVAGCGGGGGPNEAGASYIEPVKNAPPLPSYVPAAGDVNVLNNTNGLLTNHFNEVTAPYYQKFYTYGIRNGDSGAVLNPYWGTYGAILCNGSGDATSNDNSVIILEIGQNNCTFKRLTNPSPIAGYGTDTATQKANSLNSTLASGQDYSWGEYLVDGQPCAAHTYAGMDVIGPQNGGATNGTYIRVFNGAQAANGQVNCYAAHKVDFPTSTGVASDVSPFTSPYNWQRVGTINSGRLVNQCIPNFSISVPKQNRIYMEDRLHQGSPRWFNLSNQLFEQGTGTALTVSDATTAYSGILVHIPERDLVVFGRAISGNLVINYMSVGAADINPSWVGPVTLSPGLAVGSAFSCLTWCPDNQLLIAGSGGANASDTAAVYEIAIPTALSNAWTVTRAPIGLGGSIPWPNQTGTTPGAPTYKSWTYNPATRSIVYFPLARGSDNTGDDTVYVYRPRGT